MSDNTVLENPSPANSGDTIRTIDRTTSKTQVVQLDAGGEAGESLVSASNPLPVTVADFPANQDVTVTNASIPVTGAFYQATQPVSGTFYPATQPVSIAATIAENLTQIGGTAVGVGNPLYIAPGTGATFAVNGTFWQATQPVSGTFWQATQPVSGTVTANQGTAATTANRWPVQLTDGTYLSNLLNLTNAKPLTVAIVDGSGNQITSFGGGSGGTSLADGATFTRGTTSETPAGGVVEALQSGLTVGKASALSLTTGALLRVDGSNATQPVSGTFWQATQPVSGTFWQATQPVSLAATVSENLAQYGGTAVGATNAQYVQPGTGATFPVSGTFFQTTQPVSVAAAVTVSQSTAANLNATVVGTVTADIKGNAGATLDAVITAATAPANGLAVLAVNETTAPSLTTGQSVAVQASWDGSVFVKPYRRSNTKPVAGTIASATAATLLAAQATGVFADLACLVLTVDPTTAVGGLSVNISDGTITYKFWFDIGTVPSTTVQNNIPPVNLTFDPPIAATSAATAWTIALSVADATIYYVANFVLQKAS